MSNAISYYDWELNFRQKTVINPKSKGKKTINIVKKNVNSLGISDNTFKDFMNKWKEKNL